MTDQNHEAVREHYAIAATPLLQAGDGCCDSGCCDECCDSGCCCCAADDPHVFGPSPKAGTIARYADSAGAQLWRAMASTRTSSALVSS